MAATDWTIGQSGPLHVSVLFMDLVSSTDVASVTDLERYAEFSRAFQSTCREQCQYYLAERSKDKYRSDGTHYLVEVIGDELAVFLHTEKPHDDVYQLICLAISLKCAWLGTPLNASRVESGRPSFELAAGIHSGPVWATRTADGFERSGFAINLAKRIESASREGERFRIYLSDSAFKLVNRRMRNVLFGPRKRLQLKGVTPEIAAYEVVESFVNPARCLPPSRMESFARVARRALGTDTFDLWIHSCLQNAAARSDDRVSEESLELCKQVLNMDPNNAVALYYHAEACFEADDFESARLYLEDLTRFWPGLGDGWLALARTFEKLGDAAEARRCLLQARRHGVSVEEAPVVAKRPPARKSPRAEPRNRGKRPRSRRSR